jgi:hypothetical protein
MTVRRHVNAEDHTREINVHTRIKAPHKSTPPLTKVSPKAVERNPKGQDVKDITDQEMFTIQ